MIGLRAVLCLCNLANNVCNLIPRDKVIRNT